MSTAFVYGTLMFPGVLHALCKRQPATQKATISGYRRYRIRDQVFPGTVQADADSQVGLP